ncbi:prepilin-type N-terminal cleavage/methylation domain-containing protein [bacterium]|nr:prepilin-type N-terminal cleavage/methylation domain-containing protein [bacterium]
MKKFGFTLAEVLITLGIVGVVAALTTPALYHNAGLAQVGPKLAKVKSTIENANKMMLQENEVGMLSTLFMDLYYDFIRNNAQVSSTDVDNLYIERLQDRMRLERGQLLDDSYRISAYDGTNIPNDQTFDVEFSSRRQDYVDAVPIRRPSWRTAEEMKLGFQLFMDFDRMSQGSDHNGNPAIDEFMGVIYVDINGNAGPNRCGKDIFAFILINDGSLLPFGTSATTVVNGNAVFRQKKPMRAAAACPDANGNVLSTRAGGYGLSCTAKIFEDNLRVTYED